MKLSGHLTLEIVDEITGKVINTIKKDNIITDFAYTNLADDILWRANNIFISTETAIPVRSKTSIQCSGTAAIGIGQPQRQAFSKANPPYFVITQRFESVTTARTFQTVGLTTSSTGQVVNTTVSPWAYLLLNQPCTQEVNQILNVIYRITVETPPPLPNQSKSIYYRGNSAILLDLVSRLGLTANKSYITNTAANAPLKEYGWTSTFTSRIIPNIVFISGNGAQLNNGSDPTLFYRSKQFLSFPRDSFNSRSVNGRVINGIHIGLDNVASNQIQAFTGQSIADADSLSTNSSISSFQALGYNQTVNLQSAFSYSNNPRDDVGPMFLPDNNSSGTGVIQFSEDPWTGIWPTIYRIKITESGNVGTAKFVLGVKNFTSFNSNNDTTLSENTRSCHPYVFSVIKPYEKAHGWQLTMPILAWDNSWTVQADNTGVSIINQFTGQHYDLDATTTPALPITAFRQMAFDQANNFIYIACSATGLWRLNIANKNAIVVNNLSTSPTYAVDVDAAGIVYVFMNKTASTLILTSSASNYVTDLGFTTVALTTADRLNIYINKLHPDTRIAIAIRNGSISFQLSGATMYWWSLAQGNQGSFTTNLEWCGESQCSFAWVRNSDTRIWTGNAVLLVYGTDTAIGSRTTKTSPRTTANILPIYDNETYRLLNGTLLPDKAFNTSIANVNIAQDYWGYLISVGFSSQGENASYSPATGLPLANYISQISSTNKIRLVGLPNGIVLSDVATFYLWNNGMNNDDRKWIWYKWNGTNWIPAVDFNIVNDTFTNTTGSATRTTSNSFTDLLDGINIKFTNGTSGTSFIEGEVYDQYVCKGTLKTNDTDLYIDHCIYYTQPLFERITLTPTIITAPNNYGIVADGAPGNTSLSAAVSAITINPLWYALLPEAFPNTMQFYIDGVLVNTHYTEGRSATPAQNTLTTGQCVSYRNGLVLFSTADVGKTVTGYFSYVAKSD